MAYLPPEDRHQLRIRSLDECICKDNLVRFIDALVDQLGLPKLGFIVADVKTEGRPAFDSKVFLKLYLYGYLNGLRSRRKLEKEAIRNVEVHWLLGYLAPNYQSISDFRKINTKALRSTFKLFVLFLKDADLITGEVLAIDGTKVRASNSKKNNYSAKKIARHLTYIEERTNEYLSELDRNDQQGRPERVSQVEEKIAKLKANKIKYEVYRNALGDIALEAKSNLSLDTFRVLVDKCGTPHLLDH